MLEDIPRPGLWKRLLLGAVLCVIAAAAATAGPAVAPSAPGQTPCQATGVFGTVR
jgi:hypothetical protein